jgi:hypothetical protein
VHFEEEEESDEEVKVITLTPDDVAFINELNREAKRKHYPLTVSSNVA